MACNVYKKSCMKSLYLEQVRQICSIKKIIMQSCWNIVSYPVV